MTLIFWVGVLEIRPADLAPSAKRFNNHFSPVMCIRFRRRLSDDHFVVGQQRALSKAADDVSYARFMNAIKNTMDHSGRENWRTPDDAIPEGRSEMSPTMLPGFGQQQCSVEK